MRSCPEGAKALKFIAEGLLAEAASSLLKTVMGERGISESVW